MMEARDCAIWVLPCCGDHADPPSTNTIDGIYQGSMFPADVGTFERAFCLAVAEASDHSQMVPFLPAVVYFLAHC